MFRNFETEVGSNLRPQPVPPEDIAVDDVERFVESIGVGRSPFKMFSNDAAISNIDHTFVLLFATWKYKRLSRLFADHRIGGKRRGHIHSIAHRIAYQCVWAMH